MHFTMHWLDGISVVLRFSFLLNIFNLRLVFVHSELEFVIVAAQIQYG